MTEPKKTEQETLNVEAPEKTVEQSIPEKEPEKSNETNETQNKSTDSKKMTPKKAFLMGLGGALVLVSLVSSVGAVYVWPLTSYARSVSKVIPFPAGYVGGTFISMHDFLREEDVLIKGGEVDSKETRQLVMESLISKTAVDSLAKQYDLELDTAEADAYYQDVINQVGDEEQLKVELENQFGVDVVDFKERVIRSIVLAGQLQDKVFSSEDEQKEAKEEAEKWHQRFVAGDQVADMQVDAGNNVRLYDGKEADGIPMSQIPPDALEVVSNLSVGDVSDVINLSETYTVVRLIDRTDDEDPVLKLDLVQVAKRGLQEKIDEYTKSTTVWSFVGRPAPLE